MTLFGDYSLLNLRLQALMNEYQWNQKNDLRVDDREDWIRRFRALVGPGGFEFEGKPQPGETITLWRGTEFAEHANGLSWTTQFDVADKYAFVRSKGGGFVWRVEAPPESILYRPGVTFHAEYLLDTADLDIRAC